MRIDARIRVRIASTAVIATVASFLAVATGAVTSPVAAAGSDLTLSFLAGTGTFGAPTEGPATSSSLYTPMGIALGPAGSVYFTDFDSYRVMKVTADGALSFVAGTGEFGAPTEGPATSSRLYRPAGVAVDTVGNVYIADRDNNRVEKVSPDGTLSFFAGTGEEGIPTEGPATSSRLNGPSGVAVDAGGNVYITDRFNSRVEKVAPDGTLSIIAGTGVAGGPTPGPATSSKLHDPTGIAVDAGGNVYVSDSSNNRVERITPGGTLSILAGNGQPGPPIAGVATRSTLNFPQGLAVDSAGDVFIAEFVNGHVDMVTPDGTLSVIAGAGRPGPVTEGPALSTQMGPNGVAVDPDGNVYVADGEGYVEKLTHPRTAQAISFTAPTAGAVGVDDVLVATGGASGNPVVFTVDPSSGAGVCSVSGTNGTVLSYGDAGSCVIDANQAGGIGYSAAPQVQKTIAVNLGAFDPGPTASITAVGNTLSARVVTSSPAPDSVTYLWTASGVAIATTDQVVLTAEQVDQPIAVTITEHKAGYADASATAVRKGRVVVSVTGQQIYGSTTPVFAASIAPVADVSLAGTVSCTTLVTGATIGATTPAGVMALVGSNCSGLSLSGSAAGDYDLAYASGGSFTVAQKSVTVTASDASTTYRAALPTITASYAGFVNADTSSVLTTAPTCSTTATATSPVGTYPTSCAGAAADNYTFTYTAGTLSITKAAQTITFSQPADTVVGGPDVALSASASSGLAVSFTSVTPGTCTIVAGKAHLTGTGACTITATQTGNGNYLPAAAVNRSLSVAKAPITVTTSSTSSLLSLLTFRVGYTTTVTSAVTGQPVAGESVTTRINGGSGNISCIAVTNASGVATCTAGPVQISLLAVFTATVAEAPDYLAGTATGRTSLL